jgi:SWIM zinc finger
MQAYRDRKYRATTQIMSITYFKLQDNQIDFRVGVIGARKIPYILDFCQSTMNITCTCPDYEKREHKPLCKHMLFIVNLSNQRNMFNNLTRHDELKDAAKLTQIRESIMAVIDQKKLSAELGESNTVSIERDDFCSICMCDLEDQIEKCTVCAHVMHKICITSWWDLSSRWNSIKGKCPYCKDPRGFSHIRQDSEDPWHNFDFSNGSEAADQQVPELLLPAAEEAADQQVPELLLPAAEEQHDQGINLIRRMNQVLSFINSFGNLNMNDPRIQYLESRLESLQQEHNVIQNAFQAQPQ